MEVFDAIKGRRSVRAFKKENVSEKAIEMLIEAATWAPSAGNTQPWEFIIIRERETRKRLSKAALNQEFLEEAPVLITVCANEIKSSQRYGTRGTSLYCIQDTAAAIQNIHLMAFSLGLGTCWVGAFDECQVREILHVPEGIRPVAIIPVGYPNEKPVARRRQLMSEIIHSEMF
jgi:nitroreductase